jgi:poly(3-hydroxybutyrate) depolymerase
VWGTSDYTVSQQYGPMDAQAMRLVYGGTFTKGASATVAGGGTNVPYTDANGRLRTTEITVGGMGHAWPAGSGGQNTNFVDAAHVNYPAFVMDFWSRNNLRMARVAAPVVDSCNASVSGTTVTVSGSGTDTAGSISSWRVVLNGPSAVNDTAAGSGASFAKSYTNLANGYYTGSVTATDSGTGLTSNACSIAQFLVGTPPALQPPAGLAVSAATSNSVTLTWNAAGGATGYNVYRNGSRVNAVTGTSYTDAGLAASTTYSYQVSSTNGGGESALSAAVAATTASGWTCSATTSTNYAHVQAGRAHDSGGYALANGSNQNMGLDNTFYTSTLAQTAPGYYVIGSCP